MLAEGLVYRKALERDEESWPISDSFLSFGQMM